MVDANNLPSEGRDPFFWLPYDSEWNDDGQELRYSENRSGQQSLAGHALANIEVIRTSLEELRELAERLKCRLLDFLDERKTGSYTPECSRSDLMEIARILPIQDPSPGMRMFVNKALPCKSC